MKKLFKQIVDFIKNLYGDTFELLRNKSGVAVKVTDKLKSVVESPFADVVVDLIPGDVDNAILTQLKVVVPKVAWKLSVAHGILQASDTNSDAIAKLIEKLKEMHPEARVAFWVLFAGEVNLALSDGKITLSEALTLSQLAYTEIKKKK